MPGVSDTQPLRAQLRPLVAEFRSMVDETMPISLVNPAVTMDAAEARQARGRDLADRMAAVVDGTRGGA